MKDRKVSYCLETIKVKVVSGVPYGSITWLKQGKEVHEFTCYKFQFDVGGITLSAVSLTDNK